MPTTELYVQPNERTVLSGFFSLCYPFTHILQGSFTGGGGVVQISPSSNKQPRIAWNYM